MSQDSWRVKYSEPEINATYVKFTGAGAAPVVEVFGRGVTCTRTGVGIVNLVWDENMGTYMGIMGYCYEATTASAVKGYTLVPGAYNATTRTLTLNMTSAAEALVDLAAAQQLSVTVGFKRANA
jgi:hypothetical protein